MNGFSLCGVNEMIIRDNPALTNTVIDILEKEYDHQYLFS